MDVEEQRPRDYFHYLLSVYNIPPNRPTLPTLIIACGALAGGDRGQGTGFISCTVWLQHRRCGAPDQLLT